MGERSPELMEEIGGRLRLALQMQSRSIRSVQSAMSARGSEISSYGAIRAYVQGEKVPPLSFLLEAAADLKVRPEWLILGAGAMTLVEEDILKGADTKFRKGTPELERWPESARMLFNELLTALLVQAPDFAERSDDIPEIRNDLARELVWLVEFPLQEWGFKTEEDLSEREFANYLRGTLNSLLLIARDFAQGEAIADPRGLLPYFADYPRP